MKKTIKKIIMVILTIIADLSLVLMTAEQPDGSINFPWTFGWLAALLVCAGLLDKMGAFKDETTI